MSSLETVEKRMLTRRNFSKAAAATAAFAAVGLAGCAQEPAASSSAAASSEAAASAEEAEPMANEASMDAITKAQAYGERNLVEGEWIPAACWHNCGGRCVNKVLVQDGVVVRQKTDDSVEDTIDNPQQRGCVRGRAQRMQVFGEDRLKYPMKRASWSPDDPHGELRGKDEWERISWDEAISYIADELKKAYETYGPKSVLMGANKGLQIPLNAMGGACTITDTSSCGSLSNGTAAKMGLGLYNWFFVVNDRYDLRNAEYIILHGANPAWTASGMPINNYLQAKKAGAQFVVVGPAKNATANTLDARWIPCRASTDTALMLGVAYEMLQADEEVGDVIDWDFLHTYTVGFDAESMPEGAATDENFKDYVLGAYDDTPKTAEWASNICGTPVEDIRFYAEILGKQHKTMLLHGFAPMRALGSEDSAQIMVTLGAMGGHFGKPGHATGGIREQSSGNDGPTLVGAGEAGAPEAPVGTIYEPIPAATVWQNILDKKYRYVGTMYGELVAGEERDLDIHVIAFESTGALRTTPNALKGIEAVRSVDFVFASEYCLNTQAKYADIVLPCTTEWETPGGFPNANRETLIVYRKVVDPLFEAKTDFEIGKLLAEALGLPADELFSVSLEQQFANRLVGCWYLDETYQPQPLVSVTQEDLDALGIEGVPHDGVIPLQKLLDDGVYHVPRSEGDAYSFIGYADYIADPEGAPRTSASGKIEIYSQAKADEFNAPGVITDVKPYPTYRVSPVGWETTFANWETQEKGDYPFIAYNPHYYRRTHSCLDNVLWQREAWVSPVFINASDAKEAGIADGDTVVIESKAGKTLRPACVMESIMPGNVGIPHGAWVDLDENEEYDTAGCDNVLIDTAESAGFVSGYNNINVNISKYDGPALVPDCEKPQRIIEL